MGDGSLFKMIVGDILKSLDLSAVSLLGNTLWEMDYILMIPRKIYKFCACDKKKSFSSQGFYQGYINNLPEPQ